MCNCDKQLNSIDLSKTYLCMFTGRHSTVCVVSMFISIVQ